MVVYLAVGLVAARVSRQDPRVTEMTNIIAGAGSGSGLCWIVQILAALCHSRRSLEYGLIVDVGLIGLYTLPVSRSYYHRLVIKVAVCPLPVLLSLPSMLRRMSWSSYEEVVHQVRQLDVLLGLKMATMARKGFPLVL